MYDQKLLLLGLSQLKHALAKSNLSIFVRYLASFCRFHSNRMKGFWNHWI